MKNYGIFTFAIALFFSFLTFSCANKDFFDKPDSLSLEIQSPYGEWKLTGIGGNSSDKVVVLSPVSEETYHLTLKSDSTFSGTSSANTIGGKLFIDSKRYVIKFVSLTPTTTVTEKEDGSRYLTYLREVFEYRVSTDELRLYFNKNTKEFLKYKRVSSLNENNFFRNQ